MGDLNQFNWIKQQQDLIRGPVLEIRSRHYAAESAVDYRRLCDGLEFIGVDITEGTNVDEILDFTSDPELISEHLPQKFGTVICCSVLEHVENVFKMAENISHVVASSGTLFLSVPFLPGDSMVTRATTGGSLRKPCVTFSLTSNFKTIFDHIFERAWGRAKLNR